MPFGNDLFGVSFIVEDKFVECREVSSWGPDFTRCYLASGDTIYLNLYINALRDSAIYTLQDRQFFKNCITRIKDRHACQESKAIQLHTLFQGVLVDCKKSNKFVLEYMGYNRRIIPGYELSINASFYSSGKKRMNDEKMFKKFLESILVQKVSKCI